MELRDYQQAAIESTLGALAAGQHQCIVVATGGGKSLIIAALAAQLDGRVLIVTNRKELLVQNAGTLGRFAPGEQQGTYSAGLGQRDTQHRVLFAGVQSAWRRMAELQQAGRFATIIVDECHLVSPSDSTAKLYNTVFAACPQAQRIGLSATPFRLDAGLVYGPSPCWFDVLAHNSDIKSLTPQWLAPLKGVLTAANVDLTGVRTRQGEYVTSDLSQAACDEPLIEATLNELCHLARNRQHWLLFGVDLAHVEVLTKGLAERGVAVGSVTGKTPKDQRAQILEDFREGRIRALVNCELLTTGADFPFLDCIALVRPSQSKGLIIQMLGRGCRQHPAKQDCLILDYAHALELHAPLSELDSLYRSPARVAADTKAAETKARQKRQGQFYRYTHERSASQLDPMSDEAAPQVPRPVQHVAYEVKPSKRYPDKNNLVVHYRLTGSIRWVTQWLVLEYGSRVREQQWFARRQVPMPATAREALGQARQYPKPTHIVVKKDGPYYRVVIEQFAEGKTGWVK